MHGTRNSKILPLMRFKGFYYTPLLKIKGGGGYIGIACLYFFVSVKQH